MNILNKKVLIVEDEDSMREALKEALSSANFSILEATNGNTGLDLALKDNPAIIILDIVMPEMDGLTMLKKLRQSNDGQFVPVIILTNLNEKEKLAEALEIGVSEYLVKTEVTLNEIVQKVKKILGLV